MTAISDTKETKIGIGDFVVITQCFTTDDDELVGELANSILRYTPYPTPQKETAR